MSSQIKTKLLDVATAYDQLTPAYRNILIGFFLDEEGKRRDGIYTAIYSGIKTIARKTGYGTTTIKKFLNEMESFGSNLILKRTKKIGCRSNHYEISEEAFEFLTLVRACHFERCWKRVREEVIQGLAEDELYLAEKLYRKGYLSTTKVSTSHLAKVSTIKLLLLTRSGSERMRTEKDDRTRFADKSKKPSQEAGIIQDINLSEKDKKWLSENYAYVDLRRARDDYDVYRYKWGNTVYNPGGFINKRALAHAKKRIWR